MKNIRHAKAVFGKGVIREMKSRNFDGLKGESKWLKHQRGGGQ